MAAGKFAGQVDTQSLVLNGPPLDLKKLLRADLETVNSENISVRSTAGDSLGDEEVEEEEEEEYDSGEVTFNIRKSKVVVAKIKDAYYVAYKTDYENGLTSLEFVKKANKKQIKDAENKNLLFKIETQMGKLEEDKKYFFRISEANGLKEVPVIGTTNLSRVNHSAKYYLRCEKNN